ncbi:hypothetical protein V8C26DRAFT_105228 [Trichoderma gracile]
MLPITDKPTQTISGLGAPRPGLSFVKPQSGLRAGLYQRLCRLDAGGLQMRARVLPAHPPFHRQIGRPCCHTRVPRCCPKALFHKGHIELVTESQVQHVRNKTHTMVSKSTKLASRPKAPGQRRKMLRARTFGETFKASSLFVAFSSSSPSPSPLSPGHAGYTLSLETGSSSDHDPCHGSCVAAPADLGHIGPSTRAHSLAFSLVHVSHFHSSHTTLLFFTTSGSSALIVCSDHYVL